MKLKRSGRELYRLQITTVPTVASWEASFDGEATWDAGTSTTYDIPGGAQDVPVFEWLVVGPAGTVGAALAVITADTIPAIRATTNPEIIVRDAPTILLED